MVLHMKKLFILPVLLLAFVAGNVQFASAQSGACLAFKAGDYVTLDTSLGNFGTQNFSIETSFKVANTSNMTLITKRPVCSHSNFWSLSIVSGKLVFEVDENAAGLNYYNLYSASTIVPGNWYHVAVTRTGLTLRIYVNGVEEGFVTQTTITNLINTADLKIGQGPCSSFVGQIDETRIWSRALTACEINSFRSCEIATSFNGLLGNYHYNQGVAAGSNPTMNYLLDVSGTTHNGSLINFTLSGTNSNWVGNGSVVSGQSCIASTNNVPRAYITNQNNPNVLVYDLNTNTEIAKVNIGNGGYGVACTPNGKSVYVANVATGKICEIDAFTHTVTAQISVGLNPFGVCMKPDGTRVYAINSGSNSVSVINTTNNSVVTTIPVTGSPYYGACSPNGQLLYVGSSNLNAVLVINTNTNTIVSTISVGTAPRGIAVSPDGTKIYVCNSTSHTVSVIQASTNTVVATIPGRYYASRCFRFSFVGYGIGK
jgi:YVTN family beta-propeller protein